MDHPLLVYELISVAQNDFILENVFLLKILFSRAHVFCRRVYCTVVSMFFTACTFMHLYIGCLLCPKLNVLDLVRQVRDIVLMSASLDLGNPGGGGILG